MTEYNSLVIFDLDGVLIDSREMHFDTLNVALAKVNPSYVIKREEHLSIYDGLSTTKKLALLAKNKGLPDAYHNHIWKWKQEATLEEIQKINPDPKLIEIFQWLKNEGYAIAVASNSITETVKKVLDRLDLTSYIDYIQSNETVIRPKPYPEMYWNCMMLTNAIPATTLIIEDSHIGRQGALDSGAHLLPVKNPGDLTLDKVKYALDKMEESDLIEVPWIDESLNVLIPMAGAGSRFAQAGYTFPKPLIEVNGKPMIQAIVENLNIKANYIFIVQKEHLEKYNLEVLLENIAPGCSIRVVDGLTEGAACTTLIAEDLINNDQPLLLANSDQIVDWNSNEVMYAFAADEIDGGILTFKSSHPKWSYAKLAPNGFVDEVAEKKPISTNATVGIYYWKRGSDYVKYARQMIDKNIRTNNEFYVAPVYNEAIEDGKKIRIKEVSKMWGVGTPEDLNDYLRHHKE